MNQGVARAWQALAGLDPEDVCRRTGAVYDADKSTYQVLSYGQEITISPTDSTMAGQSEMGEILIGRLGYFSGLSLLNYLVHAQTPEVTGRWIKPTDIRGMETYFTGSHRLPLEGVASRFARDADGFMEQGMRLGGEPASFGDASLRLLPMAGFPVVLILWLEDDEFAARADLLFDEVCQKQAPIDIVWSIAMLTVLAMQM